MDGDEDSDVAIDDIISSLLSPTSDSSSIPIPLTSPDAISQQEQEEVVGVLNTEPLSQDSNLSSFISPQTSSSTLQNNAPSQQPLASNINSNITPLETSNYALNASNTVQGMSVNSFSNQPSSKSPSTTTTDPPLDDDPLPVTTATSDMSPYPNDSFEALKSSSSLHQSTHVDASLSPVTSPSSQPQVMASTPPRPPAPTSPPVRTTINTSVFDQEPIYASSATATLLASSSSSSIHSFQVKQHRSAPVSRSRSQPPPAHTRRYRSPARPPLRPAGPGRHDGRVNLVESSFVSASGDPENLAPSEEFSAVGETRAQMARSTFDNYGSFLHAEGSRRAAWKVAQAQAAQAAKEAAEPSYPFTPDISMTAREYAPLTTFEERQSLHASRSAARARHAAEKAAAASGATFRPPPMSSTSTTILAERARKLGSSRRTQTFLESVEDDLRARRENAEFLAKAADEQISASHPFTPSISTYAHTLPRKEEGVTVFDRLYTAALETRANNQAALDAAIAQARHDADPSGQRRPSMTRARSHSPARSVSSLHRSLYDDAVLVRKRKAAAINRELAAEEALRSSSKISKRSQTLVAKSWRRSVHAAVSQRWEVKSSRHDGDMPSVPDTRWNMDDAEATMRAVGIIRTEGPLIPREQTTLSAIWSRLTSSSSSGSISTKTLCSLLLTSLSRKQLSVAPGDKEDPITASPAPSSVIRDEEATDLASGRLLYGPSAPATRAAKEQRKGKRRAASAPPDRRSSFRPGGASSSSSSSSLVVGEFDKENTSLNTTFRANPTSRRLSMMHDSRIGALGVPRHELLHNSAALAEAKKAAARAAAEAAFEEEHPFVPHRMSVSGPPGRRSSSMPPSKRSGPRPIPSVERFYNARNEARARAPPPPPRDEAEFAECTFKPRISRKSGPPPSPRSRPLGYDAAVARLRRARENRVEVDKLREAGKGWWERTDRTSLLNIPAAVEAAKYAELRARRAAQPPRKPAQRKLTPRLPPQSPSKPPWRGSGTFQAIPSPRHNEPPPNLHPVLMHMDVAISPERTVRLTVYKDDDPAEVSSSFARRHGLDPVASSQLEAMVATHMLRLLRSETAAPAPPQKKPAPRSAPPTPRSPSAARRVEYPLSAVQAADASTQAALITPKPPSATASTATESTILTPSASSTTQTLSSRASSSSSRNSGAQTVANILPRASTVEDLTKIASPRRFQVGPDQAPTISLHDLAHSDFAVELSPESQELLAVDAAAQPGHQHIKERPVSFNLSPLSEGAMEELRKAAGAHHGDADDELAELIDDLMSG